MRAALLLVLALLTACSPRVEQAPPPPPPPPPPPATEPEPAAPDRPYVVLVSFDGMRHDLIDRVETPSFDRVIREGVRAEGLIPSYPSKTFPNHYTLATGLYPANHGIVDNSFYDPALDLIYRIGDRSAVENPRFYGGEPIWVTAEEQGVRAASFFWVGSEAPVQGLHPTYFKYYDHDFPYEARVDTVLHWLALPPAERPQLVTLYFDQPDGILHALGPDAPPVDDMVRDLDRHLGRLLDGLDALPIADSTTVLLVSDHGMAAVPQENVIFVDDYADLEGVRVVNNTTQTFLYFDGDEQRLWATYEALRDRIPNATVYLRDETPERWHYSGNPRIGDVVISADLGWILRTRRSRTWDGGGMHGWDNFARPMHGIFMARGPRIRAGHTLPPFQNIHVYPFLAELLGLDPAEVDGRLEVLAPILRADAMAH